MTERTRMTHSVVEPIINTEDHNSPEPSKFSTKASRSPWKIRLPVNPFKTKKKTQSASPLLSPSSSATTTDNRRKSGSTFASAFQLRRVNTNHTQTSSPTTISALNAYDLRCSQNTKEKFTKDVVQHVAVSPTGTTIVHSTRNMFWVHNTNPEIKQLCTAMFLKEGYQFSSYSEMNRKAQRPAPNIIKISNFEQIAVHDKFLAVAMKDRVLIISVDNAGETGKWLCTCEMQTPWIAKLVFSSDGVELFVLVRVHRNGVGYERIVVFSAVDFVPPSLERAKPHIVTARPVMEWEMVDQTVDFTVSKNRKLVVLWTCPRGEFATIRFLKETERGWSNLGCTDIRTCNKDEAKTALAAVNGIRL
jgi:hypothetical protein